MDPLDEFKEADQFKDEFAPPKVEGLDDVPAKVEVEAEIPESLKNRQHRRLEQKLQAEREANIALNARLQALAETTKFKEDVGDIDLTRIYGTDSDAAKQATEILQNAFEKNLSKAEERAYARLVKEREESAKEEAEASKFIDNEFEALEDTYNVDLTTNSPAARKARAELLDLIEKLSPKDSEGNIKEYADFSAAFEMLQKQPKQPTRNKDLASRGMAQSGTSTVSAVEEASLMWLKNNIF